MPKFHKEMGSPSSYLVRTKIKACMMVLRIQENFFFPLPRAVLAHRFIEVTLTSRKNCTFVSKHFKTNQIFICQKTELHWMPSYVSLEGLYEGLVIFECGLRQFFLGIRTQSLYSYKIHQTQHQDSQVHSPVRMQRCQNGT